ncbi:hypothetical protein SLS62_006210 [Diatrype stigma]|uniref:Cytochrome P450 n=1 Tax=Diatrype stigma TaxID=117547 RepID=A0AAN9YRW9_9PEZI
MTTPIPQPPGVPLLGNIFDVNPNNTWASLKKLAEKYGEIFQITVLGKTLVFVAGVALAEELCDERRFRKFVGGPIVEIRHAVHDSLFTAFPHEEAGSWGVAHRIIAPQLSPDVVAANMFDAMRDATAALVEKWTAARRDGDPHVPTAAAAAAAKVVSPLADLNRLTLEVTTRTLYGQTLSNSSSGGGGGGSDDAESEPPHPMVQAMEDATSEAMKRPTRPRILNWLFYGGKFQRATDAMRAYAAEIVRNRRQQEQEEGEDEVANPSSAAGDNHDLLWALMHGADPQTGRRLTDEQVIDEVVTMPIGSATAPGLLSSALHYLAANPHVVAKARRELDAVVGVGGERPLLKREHLPRLKYVEAVLRESLRLTFPAPGFNIEPIPREGPDGKSPVLLAGGKYAVAHDQPMIIVLSGVNRDPTVFADPDRFDPDRMMAGEEAFERLPAGATRWFGNGRRECIGRHWAWQFSFVVLATLLREVDLETADADHLAGGELRQDGWFCLRPVDFYLKVRPRAD